MIGDTHRLLANIRRTGYVTTTVQDSTGRTAWDIWFPRINHNFTTGVNDVDLEYMGKVERYGSPQIGNWSPFGRPFYYAHPSVSNFDRGQEVIGVVRRTPRATLRYQF